MPQVRSNFSLHFFHFHFNPFSRWMSDGPALFPPLHFNPCSSHGRFHGTFRWLFRQLSACCSRNYWSIFRSSSGGRSDGLSHGMADPLFQGGVGKSFQNSTMSPLKKIAARFLGILKRRQWLGLKRALLEPLVLPKLLQAEDVPAISRQCVRQCHGNMVQAR